MISLLPTQSALNSTISARQTSLSGALHDSARTWPGGADQGLESNGNSPLAYARLASSQPGLKCQIWSTRTLHARSPPVPKKTRSDVFGRLRSVRQKAFRRQICWDASEREGRQLRGLLAPSCACFAITALRDRFLRLRVITLTAPRYGGGIQSFNQWRAERWAA
jgi:hypothetical protein